MQIESLDVQACANAAHAAPNTASLAERAIALHRGGKMEVCLKVPLASREDLALAYTPGFAYVARAIHAEPSRVRELTTKASTVAIVTDGTAVSGIGNVGPEAALPVMEGKALLFKRFADINAYPICLATTDVDEIVATVKAISPGFGAIMLEDISAPRCFEIEARLQEELQIPVMHDDQHATAVAATAALINTLEMVGKRPEQLRVVMVGAGAAGTACARMFLQLGVGNLVACDRTGAIHAGRNDLDTTKRWFAEHANRCNEQGTLKDVLRGADVLVGLSGPGVIGVDDIRTMARAPIVFALANPQPEITPAEVDGVVAMIATGRSDFPNQIDNGLCYPGIFRGAMDCAAPRITDRMKMAAACALASLVDRRDIGPRSVIPDIFDPRVMPAVADAVRRAA
ncbi:MAG: NADP-dependent malic enzyme [Burkholderiaceae bacterium]